MCRRQPGVDFYCHVAAGRDALGLAVKDQRKNRKSHSSQRNGLTKIMARNPRSIIPLRFDWWICSLWHCGQVIIAILHTPHGHRNCHVILLRKSLYFCPVLYTDIRFPASLIHMQSWISSPVAKRSLQKYGSKMTGTMPRESSRQSARK